MHVYSGKVKLEGRIMISRHVKKLGFIFELRIKRIRGERERGMCQAKLVLCMSWKSASFLIPPSSWQTLFLVGQ